VREGGREGEKRYVVLYKDIYSLVVAALLILYLNTKY